jgi:hypothetical protein
MHDPNAGYGGLPIGDSVMTDPKDERYDDEEAKRRFEAALHGAREAQALPMKDIPPKRAKKEKSPAQRPGSER